MRSPGIDPVEQGEGELQVDLRRGDAEVRPLLEPSGALADDRRARRIGTRERIVAGVVHCALRSTARRVALASFARWRGAPAASSAVKSRSPVPRTRRPSLPSWRSWPRAAPGSARSRARRRYGFRAESCGLPSLSPSGVVLELVCFALLWRRGRPCRVAPASVIRRVARIPPRKTDAPVVRASRPCSRGRTSAADELSCQADARGSADCGRHPL